MTGHHEIDDSEAAHTFKSLLNDLLTEADLPINAAAAKLNISSERMYKYANQGIPNSLPAYLLPLWTRMIGPELLQRLASEAHYSVAELPRVLPDYDNALDVALGVIHECAALTELFTKAVKGDDVTAKHLRQIEMAADKAIGAMLSVKLVAREMAKTVPHPRRLTS